MHWQLKKILFFLKMTVQFKFDKKKMAQWFNMWNANDGLWCLMPLGNDGW